MAPGYDPVEKGGAVLAAADTQRGERTAQARMVYQPVQCEGQAVSLTVNHVVNALVCAQRGRSEPAQWDGHLERAGQGAGRDGLAHR